MKFFFESMIALFLEFIDLNTQYLNKHDRSRSQENDHFARVELWETLRHKGHFMALLKSRFVLNSVNFSDRLLLLEHILSQMMVMLFVLLCSFQTSFSMCELLGNDVSEKRSSR